MKNIRNILALKTSFDFVISVQFSCLVVSDSLRPHWLQHTGFPVHYQLPELAQIHFHQVSDAIQPSHPLLPASAPAFNLSQHQGLFSNESVLCIRWPKYCRFGFSISPSNEYSGLISFKIDWFDLWSSGLPKKCVGDWCLTNCTLRTTEVEVHGSFCG